MYSNFSKHTCGQPVAPAQVAMDSGAWAEHSVDHASQVRDTIAKIVQAIVIRTVYTRSLIMRGCIHQDLEHLSTLPRSSRESSVIMTPPSPPAPHLTQRAAEALPIMLLIQGGLFSQRNQHALGLLLCCPMPWGLGDVRRT